MRLFLSYAQQDQDLRDQLIRHLSPLIKDANLSIWDAHDITAGSEREATIKEWLDAANIILLLISSDFMASALCDTQMKRAIERQDEARVIPILLRHCDWKDAPFAELEVSPRDRNPVIDEGRNIDAAFTEIAQKIRRVAVELDPTLAKPLKSVLKPGAPLQLGGSLPDNFVERPEALNAVKKLLLAESEKPLVVSAIAGLGGLGKSVLAQTLVLDSEVQARFDDGILWVTLGQNPSLQNLLGDLIWTLDKSRSYSATTPEAASGHLKTLLIGKRMLLVVDDVWNGAHVEHFRVGGAACRMLVTTREAQIEGAEYHRLDLMSEDEAIDLVRQKLNRRWQPEQEPEVRAFAKSLGYLPLALDLAANQVREGLSWAELRSEFEDERRLVALEVLDSSEAWETLDEQQQRRHSLRVCFNLSLRRLNVEQVRQFAWLGVLPEDVSLDVRMAMTLWDLPRLQAKKVLALLRNRSFLTSGTETLEGDPTYRVHDLMHDTARGLLEQDTISNPSQSLQNPIQNPKSKIQNLASAHTQLLDRYRQQAHDRWDRLPNDGYIHRHLTWHLQQAGLEDEIHALMAMSDEQGRNAWFEACDKIGQPAIFVQDVATGWKAAEQLYEKDRTRSIVLQSRYALITATLNSLVANLPIDMIVAFVKRKYWTPEQAWAYVEQMQDGRKYMEAFQKLAPYLPKHILKSMLETARATPFCGSRARILCALAQVDSDLFSEALKAAQKIKKDTHRARALDDLIKLDSANFDQLLREVQLIHDEGDRVWLLSKLAKLDSVNFDQLLRAAQSIQDEYERARVLSNLAQVAPTYFSEARETARMIQDTYKRASVLSTLAQVNPDIFEEALRTAQTISDEEDLADVLRDLAQVDSAYFSELLEAAQSIQDENRRARILCDLAKLNSADLDHLFEAAQEIRDRKTYVRVLISLAQVNSAYFSKALKAARKLWREHDRAEALCDLAEIDPTYFSEALEVVRQITWESVTIRKSSLLHQLARANPASFTQLLELARKISIRDRAFELRTLAEMNSANFDQLLGMAREIQDEREYASALCNLARTDFAFFPKILEATQTIQTEYRLESALRDLAKIDFSNSDQLPRSEPRPDSQDPSSSSGNTFFGIPKEFCVNPSYIGVFSANLFRLEKIRTFLIIYLHNLILYFYNKEKSSLLLKAAQAIQNKRRHAEILCILSQSDSAIFSKALKAAREVQDETDRANALCELAKVNSKVFPEALNAAREVQDEETRANALCELAKVNSKVFPEALNAVQAIWDEKERIYGLYDLAEVDFAEVNSTDFTQLLEVAQAIQDEGDRVEVLCKLAKVNPKIFPEILNLARKIKSEETRAWELRSLTEIDSMDSADFTQLLEAAQAIQDEHKRAWVLCSLTEVDSASFTQLLEAAQEIKSEGNRAWVLRSLTEVDSADFTQLLEAAQAIQDEKSRIDIFCASAKVSSDHFSRALEATQEIQNEETRADALCDLAEVDSADFDELLEAAQGIQDDGNCKRLLIALAPKLPEKLLPKAFATIRTISHEVNRAKVMSAYLPRLPFYILSHNLWQVHLHDLAYRTRKDLMQDLSVLQPAIVHLGGKDAVRGMVDAMRNVCSQWK